MPHQTLFYLKESGRLLHIEPNIFINKSHQKERFCPGLKHSQIGVYYLEGNEPVTLDDVIVQPSGDFGQRVVLTKAGKPLNLERVIEKFGKMAAAAGSIKYECEGGLGDHLLQAAACLEYKKQNPETWIGLAVKKEYESILQRIEGLDLIGWGLNANKLPAQTLTVSGRTEYMSDPRGLGYGKQSLYGSRLGLESVQGLARIPVTDSDLSAGENFLKTYQREAKRALIGIQFNSASGRAKSYPLRHVLELVKMIYAETDGEAVIFGRDWEYPATSPLGINLTGPVPWETTFQVLTLCSAVVCIDSGLLHLARSIGKTYSCLWGGSTPEYILGEKAGEYDVRLDLECKNRLCMDCPQKRPICMERMTPDLVIKKVKKMLKKKGAGDDEQILKT